MHDPTGSFLRGLPLVVALSCLAPMASAVTILEPEIVFTERYIFALNRIENDQSPGNTGYLGLISNVSGWEDRTFLDFNLIDASPASQAELSFELYALGGGILGPTKIVQLSTYAADGRVQTNDFNRPRTPQQSFTTSGIFTIDITDVHNEALGGYLGFVLSINTGQATLGTVADDPGIVTITTVPEPGAPALLALGLAILGLCQRVRAR